MCRPHNPRVGISKHVHTLFLKLTGKNLDESVPGSCDPRILIAKLATHEIHKVVYSKPYLSVNY